MADAPVDALLARADELASRWASALVAARPLAELGRVPLDSIARDGPALCAQLARALGSDAELEALLAPAATPERGQATQVRSGALTLVACLRPAGDASAAVRDVETLRGVVWELTLGELREPTVGQVAGLSERLAYVCSALVAAALERHDRLATTIDSVAAPAAAGRERIVYGAPQAPSSMRRAVLIDERDEAAQPTARRREAPVAGSAAAPSHIAARAPAPTTPERTQDAGPAPTAPRARPWDIPLDAVSRSSPERQNPAPHRAVPDGGDAEMRVTRGPGTPVDERA